MFSGSLNTLPCLRFASCGMDSLIRIWQTKTTNDIFSFHIEDTLEGHTDTIRSLIWRNKKDALNDTILSGGDDNMVYLWTCAKQTENKDSDNLNINHTHDWHRIELVKIFPAGIVKLALNEEGTHLAVSLVDGTCYLFQEVTESEWMLISETNQDGIIENLEK